MLCNKRSFFPILLKYFHRICESPDDAMWLLPLLMGLGWYVHLDIVHGETRILPMNGQHVSPLFATFGFVVMEKESSWFHTFHILADFCAIRQFINKSTPK